MATRRSVTEAEIMKTAIALAFREMFVFPVRGKIPATEHGFLDAVTAPEVEDADKVRELFRDSGATGVGVDCGRSGLLVVDLDGVGAEQAWCALEGPHGGISTIGVTTSRGRHLWLRTTDDRARNTASKLGPGIDTRGAGGYVLAPPSLHPSGHRYAWQMQIGVSFATAPEWLLELIAPPAPTVVGERRQITPGSRCDWYGRAALERQASDMLGAAEGTRHQTLAGVAYRAGRLAAAGHLERSLAESVLVDAALKAGLPEKEAARTFEECFAAGLELPVATGARA